MRKFLLVCVFNRIGKFFQRTDLFEVTVSLHASLGRNTRVHSEGRKGSFPRSHLPFKKPAKMHSPFCEESLAYDEEMTCCHTGDYRSLVVLLADRRGRLVFVVQWYRTLCCRDSLGDGPSGFRIFLTVSKLSRMAPVGTYCQAPPEMTKI